MFGNDGGHGGGDEQAREGADFPSLVAITNDFVQRLYLQTTVDFSLSDQVYARAKLSNVESVGLWLGAGVMVEYALEEAKELLVRCICYIVKIYGIYIYIYIWFRSVKPNEMRCMCAGEAIGRLPSAIRSCPERF